MGCSGIRWLRSAYGSVIDSRWSHRANASTETSSTNRYLGISYLLDVVKHVILMNGTGMCPARPVSQAPSILGRIHGCTGPTNPRHRQAELRARGFLGGFTGVEPVVIYISSSLITVCSILVFISSFTLRYLPLSNSPSPSFQPQQQKHLLPQPWPRHPLTACKSSSSEEE